MCPTFLVLCIWVLSVFSVFIKKPLRGRYHLWAFCELLIFFKQMHLRYNFQPFTLLLPVLPAFVYSKIFTTHSNPVIQQNFVVWPFLSKNMIQNKNLYARPIQKLLNSPILNTSIRKNMPSSRWNMPGFFRYHPPI